tara:strand:+ start:131 stop:850 length:720 start_codon:yes stop_codon:yes gene_type:complete
MEKDKKIKIFLGFSYLIIIILLLWIIFSKYSLSDIASYEFIKINREYLISAKETNVFIASFIFFLFTIIWVFLLGFGAPIFLIGGFIFGKWIGTFLVVFGLTSGATCLYIFANFFFKDLIKEKLTKKYFLLNEKFKKNEFLYFLIYRFVGGIPFSISNILPVLFNVKIKNFFFGSLIGMTPQLFVGVSLGAGIEKIIKLNKTVPSFFALVKTPDIYLPILGFGVLILLAFVLRKKVFKE